MFRLNILCVRVSFLSMKLLRFLFTPLLLVSAATIRAQAPVQDAIIPEAFPASRYDEIAKDSPFAVATAPVAEVAPKENPFVGMFLSGTARVGGPEGMRDIAYIKDRENTNLALEVGKEHKSGYSLVRMKWDSRTAKSVAVVKRGSDEGEIAFNQAEASSAPQQPRMPGRPGVPTPVSRRQPPSTTGAGIPTPMQNRINGPAMAPTPPSNVRRIRTIPNQ